MEKLNWGMVGGGEGAGDRVVAVVVDEGEDGAAGNGAAQQGEIQGGAPEGDRPVDC